MRILRRPAFLAMPPGTLFMKYQPCSFDNMMLKGETLNGNDYYYTDLVGAVPWKTSGDFFERCQAMEQGAVFTVSFAGWGRAGYEPDDRMYAIYERADVELLVKTLWATL